MEPGQDLPDLTLIDCLPESPFRPLDRRWQLAAYFHRHGRRRGRRWADPWVLRAWRYLRALRRAGAPELITPARRDPALVAALALRSGAELFRRLAVEATLLAGMTDLEIAYRTGLPEEVIAAYEALFFDVRARLVATDHIVFLVVGPGLYDGSALDPALVIKHLAYFGGPLVADALLTLVAGTEPYPADQPDRSAIDPEFARSFALLLALRTVPLDERSVPILVRPYARMQELDRRADADSVATLLGPLAWSPDTLAVDVALGMARRAVRASDETDMNAPSLLTVDLSEPESLLDATG
jgi:hypothetical protein